MTAARYDWIAIGPHGVYAIMDADLARPAEVSDFRREATERGHAVDLVTVSEACRRHHEYLMQFADMRAANAKCRIAAIDLPSFLPTPSQLDLFAGIAP